MPRPYAIGAVDVSQRDFAHANVKGETMFFKLHKALRLPWNGT
jgi:hypothetical protein